MSSNGGYLMIASWKVRRTGDSREMKEGRGGSGGGQIDDEREGQEGSEGGA